MYVLYLESSAHDGDGLYLASTAGTHLQQLYNHGAVHVDLTKLLCYIRMHCPTPTPPPPKGKYSIYYMPVNLLASRFTVCGSPILMICL